MTERTKDILRGAIREFIDTGVPVTSNGLYERYNFGIKPAMIRRELSELDEAEFLSQTHPSGGRVPTDKAYRFFVSELLACDRSLSKLRRTHDSLIQFFTAGSMRQFADALSEHLKLLSVVYDPETDFFYSGLHDLFRGIDADRKRDFTTIIEDFEQLPSRLMQNPSWWQNRRTWPQVFVGPSPITQSRHLAVVAEKVAAGEREVLIMAIGPRRMDYRKPIDLFRCIEESINNTL